MSISLEGPLPLLLVFGIMFFAAWFGFTFLYFISYMRKKDVYNLSSIETIIYFFGDLKNTYKFYQAFYQVHKENKYGKGLTLFLIYSHIFSPVFYFLLPITYGLMQY